MRTQNSSFLFSFCAKASISKVSFPSSALSTRRFLNLQARKASCCFCENTKQCFRCVVKATDLEWENVIDSPVAFHLRQPPASCGTIHYGIRCSTSDPQFRTEFITALPRHKVNIEETSSCGRRTTTTAMMNN